jgi:hypothetical protein
VSLGQLPAGAAPFTLCLEGNVWMTEDNAAAPQGRLPGQRVDADGLGAAALLHDRAAAEVSTADAEPESWMVPRSLANPTRLRLGINR